MKALKEALQGIVVKEAEAKRSPAWHKMVELLSEATDLAKTVHQEEPQGELWGGNEGAELGHLLEGIWAAFSTGDDNDRSHNDEIFK